MMIKIQKKLKKITFLIKKVKMEILIYKSVIFLNLNKIPLHFASKNVKKNLKKNKNNYNNFCKKKKMIHVI